jgi:hypothetical protein
LTTANQILNTRSQTTGPHAYRLTTLYTHSIPHQYTGTRLTVPLYRQKVYMLSTFAYIVHCKRYSHSQATGQLTYRLTVYTHTHYTTLVYPLTVNSTPHRTKAYIQTHSSQVRVYWPLYTVYPQPDNRTTYIYYAHIHTHPIQLPYTGDRSAAPRHQPIQVKIGASREWLSRWLQTWDRPHSSPIRRVLSMRIQRHQRAHTNHNGAPITLCQIQTIPARVVIPLPILHVFPVESTSIRGADDRHFHIDCTLARRYEPS